MLSLKQPIVWFLIVAVGLVSGLELISLISTTDPDLATASIQWAVFLSIFFCMGAVISCIWQLIRYFVLIRLLPPKPLVIIRQGFLLSATVTLCLFLNSLNILRLVDVIPLVGAMLLLEFFLQADKRPRANLHYGS